MERAKMSFIDKMKSYIGDTEQGIWEELFLGDDLL